MCLLVVALEKASKVKQVYRFAFVCAISSGFSTVGSSSESFSGVVCCHSCHVVTLSIGATLFAYRMRALVQLLLCFAAVLNVCVVSVMFAHGTTMHLLWHVICAKV